MADTYPYVLGNGKISALFDAVSNAAKPPKMSHEFLSKIGFGSSNDRAFVPLFRHLGLVSENNVPTALFDDIRDPGKRPYTLGGAIRRAYADLFSVNTNLHKAPEADIKAAISRVTGKDAEYVNRAYNTFRSLLSLAKFDGAAQNTQPTKDESGGLANPQNQSAVEETIEATDVHMPTRRSAGTSLNYNIEIHLPATTDISVYNAIFRSLRDTLGVV